ncbi:glycosyl hydrolase family 61-domain-containing protein [Ganoderma leucocontextum]|nr:glycosyl hydrolase family 61-domain-containing protein [Ganoderma leucocontextum]
MLFYHILMFFLFAFVTQVTAHGYLKGVSIDGQLYQGNVPNQTPSDSPIRLIDDIDPVKGASNPNLSCGQNAQNAALVAPANPGSQVAFSWASGNGGNWPHNTGPLMTYMALCEGTTCDKYDATNANWFKIDEAGLKSDGSGWWQQDIMNGQSYTLTLPDDIASGDYLIRHEIIALQIAVSVGGAEFYPSCTQVRIGGNGNDTPASPTVHFPGAYSDTDPGIYTPDVYNPGFVYVFPGPAIASFGTGSGDSSSASNITAPSAPTSTGFSSAPSSAPSASPVSTSDSSDPTSISGPSSTVTSTSTSTADAAPSASSTSESGNCWDEDANYNWARDWLRTRRMIKIRRSRLH